MVLKILWNEHDFAQKLLATTFSTTNLLWLMAHSTLNLWSVSGDVKIFCCSSLNFKLQMHQTWSNSYNDCRLSANFASWATSLPATRLWCDESNDFHGSFCETHKHTKLTCHCGEFRRTQISLQEWSEITLLFIATPELQAFGTAQRFHTSLVAAGGIQFAQHP